MALSITPGRPACPPRTLLARIERPHPRRQAAPPRLLVFAYRTARGSNDLELYDKAPTLRYFSAVAQETLAEPEEFHGFRELEEQFWALLLSAWAAGHSCQLTSVRGSKACSLRRWNDQARLFRRLLSRSLSPRRHITRVSIFLVQCACGIHGAVMLSFLRAVLLKTLPGICTYENLFTRRALASSICASTSSSLMDDRAPTSTSRFSSVCAKMKSPLVSIASGVSTALTTKSTQPA